MADTDSSRAAPQNGAAAAPRPDPEERWFDRVLTVFGLRPTEGLRENLAQALADDSKEDAIFSPEERRLLQNILALRDMRIIDVMIPRADINAVPEDIELADLINEFRVAGHSRLPVFRETLDDPVGFIHAKDVMIKIAEQTAGDNGFDIGSLSLMRPAKDPDIVRPILFVPPSMPAMDLMVRMQANRIQLALVVDEYGGTDGLVSLEDLIETVVGDIEDEYDWPDEATITAADDGTFIADARVELQDFEKEAGLTLPDHPMLGDVDTLGGIVFAILGRVPARGEIVSSAELPTLEFEVLEVDPRRIKSVKVRVKEAAAADGAAEADPREV